MLWHCSTVVVVRLFPCNDISSSWQNFLNFKHNDSWHWIKFRYWFRSMVTLPVFRQEPKVQKLMFLLFVHGELIFHLILMVFFSEFLRKIPFRKMHSIITVFDKIGDQKGPISIFFLFTSPEADEVLPSFGILF
jgi:hypothetical protein